MKCNHGSLRSNSRAELVTGASYLCEKARQPAAIHLHKSRIRFICSDFLDVDTVTFEDTDHLPNAGDVLGGPGLEPTDAESKPVTSEGRRLFQILTEPRSQFVQFSNRGS